MSAPIGPGDAVECIVPCNEDSPGIHAHWLCGASIELGRVYTVMRVIVDIDNFGEECGAYVLTEKDTHWPRSRDGELGAWAAGHFKPVYRRNEALITNLLTTIPAEPERVTA